MKLNLLILILILIILICFFLGYKSLQKKIKYYIKLLFGTDTLGEGIKKMDFEYANTPKSISSATNLYLPNILKDFPTFHYDEMKVRAEQVLVSFLQGVQFDNETKLLDGTDELKNQLRLYLERLHKENIIEHFERIKIHKTEINQYRKLNGRCSIIFQTAIEYIHYQEKNGKIINGKKDIREQTKYNIEMIYIQDREVVAQYADQGKALNCPNCGAPLTTLGDKICAYCDSPIIEYNLKVWSFSSINKK